MRTTIWPRNHSNVPTVTTPLLEGIWSPFTLRVYIWICELPYLGNWSIRKKQLLFRRPEICQICGKAFKTKKHLSAHILTHSDRKRYACEVCGAKLKNESCYRSHMMSVHHQTMACNICGKDYFKEEGLRRHKRHEHKMEIFDS